MEVSHVRISIRIKTNRRLSTLPNLPTIYPGEWICTINELSEWFRTRFHHQAMTILKDLQDRHLITYTLLGRGKLVKYKIKGWCKYNRVLDYNAPCQMETGFFFLPISVANELVSAGRCSEMDK